MVKGSVIPLPEPGRCQYNSDGCLAIRTDDDRRKVDRCQAIPNEHGILVIHCRSKEWDIPSLYNAPSVSAKFEYTTRNIEHTPYDSPAIWKARPLNEGKCSKKIATNAAMSWAACSEVLCEPR